MRNIPRYFTNTIHTDDKILKQICARAISLMSTGITLKRINFVGLTLNNRGMLETLLGYEEAKKIGKGFRLPSANLPVVFTAKAKPMSIEREIIVTLGLDSDDLLYIEYEAHCSCIIAIPYTDNIEKWCKITAPKSIIGDITLPPYQMPECIVIQALTSLNSINKRVPFHDSDKDRVASYIRYLLDNGIILDNLLIEAYLFTSLNWRKELIDEALGIVESLKNRSPIRYKLLENMEINYQKWKDACQPIQDDE